jgi:hypothetical protein
LTIIAIVLVIAAEVAAAMSSVGTRPPTPFHRNHPVAAATPPTASGEPQLPDGAGIPSAPRSAAVRFVRDYTLWSGRERHRIPTGDATSRVIALLTQEGRQNQVPAYEAVASIRMTPDQFGRYVVTSAIGNFLVGRWGPRWLVISLPGD